MTPQEAKEQAQRALAQRLKVWGVSDHYARADGFIAELMRHGWKFAPDASRRNPKPHEACPLHPGEYRDTCRACAADALVGDATTTGQRVTDAAEHIRALRAIKAAATTEGNAS